MKTLFVALRALSPLFTSAGTVSVERGNIVYRDGTDRLRALTTTGDCADLALSRDGRLAAFTRRQQEVEERAAPLVDVWLLRLVDYSARRLVVAKYGRHPEEELSGIDKLAFSLNGSELYFVSSAWATSGAIHAVAVSGGHPRFVVAGNNFAIVERGKFAGFLLVHQHRAKRGGGAWNPYALVSPAGDVVKVLGEFGDAQNSMLVALRRVQALR